MVFEHVSDARSSYANIHKLLSPAGICINFHPTLFSLPFLINRLLPTSASEMLACRIWKSEERRKFPAYYDRCRVSRTSRDFLLSLGFSQAWQLPFWHHDYFQFDRWLNTLAERANWTALATYCFTIVVKWDRTCGVPSLQPAVPSTLSGTVRPRRLWWHLTRIRQMTSPFPSTWGGFTFPINPDSPDDFVGSLNLRRISVAFQWIVESEPEKVSRTAGESRNPHFPLGFRAFRGCCLDLSGESGFILPLQLEAVMIRPRVKVASHKTKVA